MEILQTAIERVLRGEMHWSALRNHGLRIEFTNGVWEFGPDPEFTVVATSSDIRRGLAQLSNVDEASEWSAFILAAGFIDLEPLSDEDHELVETMWNLAFRASED